MKKKIKEFLARKILSVHYFFGSLICKLLGEHAPMTNEFEFGPDINYFYPCRRCDCCAITGETFESWYERTKE